MSYEWLYNPMTSGGCVVGALTFWMEGGLWKLVAPILIIGVILTMRRTMNNIFEEGSSNIKQKKVGK